MFVSKNLKRIFIILFGLCPLLNAVSISAQLFSTSSVDFHSYSSSGDFYSPELSAHSTALSIRSTSTIYNSTTIDNYSTAPMHVANGFIKTVASELDGNIFTEEISYIPTAPQRSIPPPTVAPLGLDWDAFVLLLLLAIAYAFYLYRKHISRIAES